MHPTRSLRNITLSMLLALAAATPAIGSRRSLRCLPSTSSIRYLELAGRTRPDTRLTSMSASPIESDLR